MSSLREIVGESLASQTHKARSTRNTEGVHLRTLLKTLDAPSDRPANRIVRRDLEQFIQQRLKNRTPTTVSKERETVIQHFRWAVGQGDLQDSPASDLTSVRRPVESTRRIDLHPEPRDELIARRERRPRGQSVVSEVEDLEVLSSDRANRAFWQPMRGSSLVPRPPEELVQGRLSYRSP